MIVEFLEREEPKEKWKQCGYCKKHVHIEQQTNWAYAVTKYFCKEFCMRLYLKHQQILDPYLDEIGYFYHLIV